MENEIESEDVEGVYEKSNREERIVRGDVVALFAEGVTRMTCSDSDSEKPKNLFVVESSEQGSDRVRVYITESLVETRSDEEIIAGELLSASGANNGTVSVLRDLNNEIIVAKAVGNSDSNGIVKVVVGLDWENVRETLITRRSAFLDGLKHDYEKDKEMDESIEVEESNVGGPVGVFKQSCVFVKSLQAQLRTDICSQNIMKLLQDVGSECGLHLGESNNNNVTFVPIPPPEKSQWFVSVTVDVKLKESLAKRLLFAEFNEDMKSKIMQKKHEKVRETVHLFMQSLRKTLKEERMLWTCEIDETAFVVSIHSSYVLDALKKWENAFLSSVRHLQRDMNNAFFMLIDRLKRLYSEIRATTTKGHLKGTIDTFPLDPFTYAVPELTKDLECFDKNMLLITRKEIHGKFRRPPLLRGEIEAAHVSFAAFCKSFYSERFTHMKYLCNRRLDEFRATARLRVSELVRDVEAYCSDNPTSMKKQRKVISLLGPGDHVVLSKISCCLLNKHFPIVGTLFVSRDALAFGSSLPLGKQRVYVHFSDIVDVTVDENVPLVPSVVKVHYKLGENVNDISFTNFAVGGVTAFSVVKFLWRTYATVLSKHESANDNAFRLLDDEEFEDGDAAETEET